MNVELYDYNRNICCNCWTLQNEMYDRLADRAIRRYNYSGVPSSLVRSPSMPHAGSRFSVSCCAIRLSVSGKFWNRFSLGSEHNFLRVIPTQRKKIGWALSVCNHVAVVESTYIFHFSVYMFYLCYSQPSATVQPTGLFDTATSDMATEIRLDNHLLLADMFSVLNPHHFRSVLILVSFMMVVFS